MPSSTSPEPSDVGPAVGGDLTATDLDREHVVTLLTEATNEGLLAPIDRDRRIAEARLAQTFDDLVPLTRDLVGGVATPPPAGNPAGIVIDDSAASGEPDQVVAIFGGASRSGMWRVSGHTNVMAVFGGVELDLTEAVWEATSLTINCFCLFGGLELVVPEGVEVRNRIAGVLGGVETKVTAPTSGAPVIELTGLAALGGVEVRNPKRKKRRDRS